MRQIQDTHNKTIMQAMQRTFRQVVDTRQLLTTIMANLNREYLVAVSSAAVAVAAAAVGHHC